VHSVSSAAALQELGQLMALGVNRVCVAPFNLQRMAQLMPLARTQRFQNLMPQGGSEAAGQNQITLAERLRDLAPEARRAAVVETLCGLLGRILGTGAAQVDVARPLSEMGLDSLMAVELADSLEHELGRPVSVMQMLQAGNVNAIADMLMAAINANAAT
jgi:acyl carrier protein